LHLPWSKEGKLIKAIKDSNLEKVENLLFSGANPNTMDAADRSVLLHAIARGNSHIVLCLLKAGANANGVTNVEPLKNHTPLMSAYDYTIVTHLLAFGGNPNAKNGDGWTPLMFASSDGAKEIVQLLLDKGADIDAIDNLGRTSIGFATHNNHIDVVKLLLDQRANPNIQSESGTSPLIMASTNGSIEIVRLLIEAKAEVNFKGEYDITALKGAESLHHSDIIDILKDAGAK
jgi:uncharacterized protein